MIVAVVVSVFTFVLPPLFSESVSAINSLPKYVKTIDLLEPLHPDAVSSIKTVFPNLPDTFAVGDLTGLLAGLIASVSGGVFDTVAGFFGGILGFVLMIVIAFYLSVRDDGVGEFLAVVTPLKHERYVRNLWLRSQHKIGKWMQGQIVLALGVGLLTYIALLIAGVPHPFLLAFVAGIFEFIPIVGMTLAVIPAFFLATLTGGFGLGLIVIGIYILIQQIESHIMYPLVVKKIVGVPPLLVIIALIAGAQLAGLAGALLAVPISVALMEFINDVEERKRVGS
jgi:predicted PurR-regulated permease PerM